TPAPLSGRKWQCGSNGQSCYVAWRTIINCSSRAASGIQHRSMIITRKVEFSASHVCRSARLSEEENRRIYGAAANPNGHGHNYVVEVSLEGEPDPVTGMVL